MSSTDFIANNQEYWQKLSTLLDQVEAQGLASLQASELDELARLYRRVSTHLAEARTTGADERTVEYLNLLVGRAYARVYTSNARRGSLLDFFLLDIPRTFRARSKYLIFAFLLSVIAAVISFTTVVSDERWGSVFVGPSASETWDAFSSNEEPAGAYFADTASSFGGGVFAGFLMSNNIRVALTAFALGITFGLGTLWVLLQNSLMVGAFLGVGAGNGALWHFISIIAPHGVTELSAILVAGAGGLIIGHALVDPGDLLRRDAVRIAAFDAVRLVVGTVPMFIVAGLIEGNISPQIEGLFRDDAPRIIFGLMVGLFFWVYLLFGDRIWSGKSTP